MTIDYADTQAIRDLLDQYFQAVGRADIDALRKMSLPESSMYGFLGKQNGRVPRTILYRPVGQAIHGRTGNRLRLCGEKYPGRRMYCHRSYLGGQLLWYHEHRKFLLLHES